MSLFYKADLDQTITLPIPKPLSSMLKSELLPHFALSLFTAESFKMPGGRVLSINS